MASQPTHKDDRKTLPILMACSLSYSDCHFSMASMDELVKNRKKQLCTILIQTTSINKILDETTLLCKEFRCFEKVVDSKGHVMWIRVYCERDFHLEIINPS